MKRTLLLLVAPFLLVIASAKTTVGWPLTGFVRPVNANPIVYPDSSSSFFCPMAGAVQPWENGDTFNPAAVVRGDSIVLLYRAEDRSAMGIGKRTSRIGYAVSADGLHFCRAAAPVLYPSASDSQSANEVPGGCEDPRVAVTEDGTYVMFYTQWNRKVARLAVSTSRDLIHWTKHGPAFAKAYNGRFKNMFTKSASILTQVKKDRLVVAKYRGKYLMYWGERWVNVATSDNLVDWTPMLDKSGEILKVMVPRRGMFDSQLTECGPPAVLTKDGIILIYNGKNNPGAGGDRHFTANTYCAGQALFSADDPTILLKRLDNPFFYPTADFEKSGQYPAGTVFTEGLVLFKGYWYLYYGCADSRVGVAVRKAK